MRQSLEELGGGFLGITVHTVGGVILLTLGSIPNSADPMVVWFSHTTVLVGLGLEYGGRGLTLRHFNFFFFFSQLSFIQLYFTLYST